MGIGGGKVGVGFDGPAVAVDIVRRVELTNVEERDIIDRAVVDQVVLI
jgi:hypothetical protein